MTQLEIEQMQQSDHDASKEWAYQLMKRDDWVILDSETTGLDHNAEACEISILNSSGRPFLSTLVRPQMAIPADATAIHGITNEMVFNAPTFSEIHSLIQMAIQGKRCIIYNEGFDRRILSQCCKLASLPALNYQSVDCAMHWYSQWCGEWNNYHGNYRWQRLPGGDHTALGDCLAVLSIIQKMAAGYVEGDRPS